MMAVRSETSVAIAQTEVIDNEDALDATPQPILRLRLQKLKSDKKVGWREDTVDNEHLNRKKSKCCCIYKKPLNFGESSSEDDEECENCFGHPEKRRRHRPVEEPKSIDKELLVENSNNEDKLNGQPTIVES